MKQLLLHHTFNPLNTGILMTNSMTIVELGLSFEWLYMESMVGFHLQRIIEQNVNENYFV